MTPRSIGERAPAAQQRRRRNLGNFDTRRCRRGLCGVDEVGRGPLAGPVVAAAVVLDPGARLAGIDDSKRLTADARELLSDAIVAQARAVAVASIAPSEIDRLNIRRATFQAMQSAILDLGISPRLVLVDGEAIPHLPWQQEAVVGGDGKSLAIACASVVAKVWRDRLMADLDRLYPGYGFARHKGYATSEHLEALVRLGPCPIHRRSFAPVRQAAQLMLW